MDYINVSSSTLESKDCKVLQRVWYQCYENNIIDFICNGCIYFVCEK